MDYIIFGTGSSATLVLLGWLLRDWGPRIRDRRPAEDAILSASDLVTRMAWARFCATCGMAILLCGLLIMAVTLGAAFFATSDRAATIAVVATFAVAILLMLAWTGIYLRQFGSFGIIRPREKPEPSTPADIPEPSGDVTAVAEAPVVEQPTPSFAETTAARGGLGRFAAFFRRDADESPSPVPEQSPDLAPVTPTASDGSDPAPTRSTSEVSSPTDAVIAELAGGIDAEDKRLTLDDPLVTSVREPDSDLPVEDAVVSEMLGPDHDLAEDVNETSTEQGASNVPADQSDQELALQQLRRRRLSRLAAPSEPD